MHQPYDDTDLNEYTLLASREPLPIEVEGRPSRAARGGFTVEIRVNAQPVIELDVSPAAWTRISRDPALQGRRTIAFVAQRQEDGSVFGELGVFGLDDEVEPWEAASCEFETSQNEESLRLLVLADVRRAFARRRHPEDLTREALSMLAELCLSGARTPDAAAVDSFLASLGGVR